MPEPETAMVWTPLTGMEAVAVTVMVVAAVSLPVLALTERLTIGLRAKFAVTLTLAVTGVSVRGLAVKPSLQFTKR